jgi:archaemetzincin
MPFQRPGLDIIRAAIGDTGSLPEAMRRLFEPWADFEPVPTPGPHDWLTVHADDDDEKGQTFELFKRQEWPKPDDKLRRMYLQPLGEFLPGRSPSQQTLKEYASVFFAIETETLPAVPVQAFTSRVNAKTNKRQILTTDVFSSLKENLPHDAFCVLAITMEDLYPAERSYDFVFGEAPPNERVGVCSFARHDPMFYGERRRPDYQTMLLRRACNVLVHETAHMFGLKHCIFFNCLMNGSNHLVESDRWPMHFCPVCLRKLQFSTSCDIVEQYEKLARFYDAVGFADEAQWTRNRLR